jgi:acetyl-CoA C-acetyltransferase
MKELPANTPVIIGTGFSQEKLDDPAASSEAWQLMVKAIRNAAEDAGKPELVRELESMTILKGMWDYKNPGQLIKEDLGCESATNILADVGNLQLSALFDLCNAIERGEKQIGVVTGGEAKYRELRSKITGVEISNTVQGDDVPEPDVYCGIPDPFASDIEINAGIFMPVELFAVIESAIRHSEGLTPDEHRDKIAELYSQFSEIAVNNPNAWNREKVSANEIRNPEGKNTMLAFPYTKKFNSQWNVNQGVAILVCSAGKAREMGLDESRWVYPLAGAQNRHVVCLGQKKQLHSQPGSVKSGEAVYRMAGIKPEDIDTADLYSCFPAAVQSWGKDLRLDNGCAWSVSGCMAFAGGPYNHASLDSFVRMAGIIRSGEGLNKEGRRIGLVSNLSGIFGKHAVVLLSNEPNPDGFGFEDVTEEVAKIDQPMPTNPEYTGPATIVGYTVAFNKEGPSHAFAYCDTPKGERIVAKNHDAALLEEMTRHEFIGKAVTINDDKTFGLSVS